MIAFWRQPGNKTMKFDGVHLTTEAAEIVIDTLCDAGFRVTDHGYKLIVRNPREELNSVDKLTQIIE